MVEQEVSMEEASFKGAGWVWFHVVCDEPGADEDTNAPLASTAAVYRAERPLESWEDVAVHSLPLEVVFS